MLILKNGWNHRQCLIFKNSLYSFSASFYFVNVFVLLTNHLMLMIDVTCHNWFLLCCSFRKFYESKHISNSCQEFASVFHCLKKILPLAPGKIYILIENCAQWWKIVPFAVFLLLTNISHCFASECKIKSADFYEYAKKEVWPFFEKNSLKHLRASWISNNF